MKFKIKTLPHYLLYSGIVFMIGCFSTTRSFNTGKINTPGQVSFTMGIGKRYHQSHFPDNRKIGTDSVGVPIYENVYPDPELVSSYNLAYKIGILAQYPFGKGLELGLISEITASQKDLPSLPTTELNLKCGFNEKVLSTFVYHSNISLGSVIGLWLDNSWFIEYAGGFQFEKMHPYFNSRLQISSSNIFQLFEDDPYDDNFFNQSKRVLIFKQTAGVAFHLKRLPVLPDIIIPEIHGAIPFNKSRKADFSFGLGLQWNNGF